MSKKIIKVHENIDFSVSTKFTKDFGLFQVEAVVYSMIYGDIARYNHDISEVELEFSMDNKPCNYSGFKELYEKLYGFHTFAKLQNELEDEFEKAYFEGTTFKN